jgi:hypothetical protein
MVNSQTLASDLQILGNPTKQEIIEESARVFEVLKPKAKRDARLFFEFGT